MRTLIFCALVLLAAGLAPAGVAAQDNTTVTRTASSTDTVTPTEENEPISISPTTEVTDWKYRGGTWVVEVESDVPTRVTLTDAAAVGRVLSEGSGPASGTARYETRNLGTGTKTIRFTAEEYEGMAAVTISATNGNQMAVIRTDSLGGGSSYVKQSTAGLLVGGAVIGTGWLTLRRLKKRLEDESKEVERHL